MGIVDHLVNTLPRAEFPAARPTLGPMRTSRGPVVFAVEDTTAQLTWQAISPAKADTGSASGRQQQPTTLRTLTARDHSTGRVVGTSPTDGGPGSMELHGLAAGTTQRINLEADGVPHGSVRVCTLHSLGREHGRFATLSDIHLGLDSFGIRGTMVEQMPDPDRVDDTVSHRCTPARSVDGSIPINLRAAEAAMDELTRWGAQHLFIKGDLVDRSTPATWAMAGRLVERAQPPLTVMTGNHEYNHAGIVSPRLGATSIGLDTVEGARRVDLNGLSVLCIDTVVPGLHGGTITDEVRERAVDLARSAPNPVMVLTHHPIERFDRAWSYPPGVPHSEGRDLLTALARHCELLLASAGHTHAHRRRLVAGIITTEVGSPKDFPGVWAGYVVCEGGVRQVIRRVASPQVRDWLHLTRLAAAGTWGRWAPGRLSDRSLQVRRHAASKASTRPT